MNDLILMGILSLGIIFLNWRTIFGDNSEEEK